MEIKSIKGVAHRLYDSYDEFKAFQGNLTPKRIGVKAMRETGFTQMTIILYKY